MKEELVVKSVRISGQRTPLLVPSHIDALANWRMGCGKGVFFPLWEKQV